MKWSGQTEAQWLEATRNWHRIYCWLPRQANDGTWVWLDYIWCRRVSNLRGGWYFEYCADAVTPEDPKPVPPRGGSSLSPRRPSKK